MIIKKHKHFNYLVHIIIWNQPDINGLVERISMARKVVYTYDSIFTERDTFLIQLCFKYDSLLSFETVYEKALVNHYTFLKYGWFIMIQLLFNKICKLLK